MFSQSEFDSLEILAENAPNDSIELSHISKLVRNSINNKDLVKETKYFKRLRFFLENHTSNKILVSGYEISARLYLLKEQYDSSIYYYTKTADFFNKNYNLDSYIEYMNKAAYYYTFLGKHDKAAKILIENLKIAEKKNLKIQHTHTLIFLGFAVRNSDRQKSLYYFTKYLNNVADTTDEYFSVALSEIGNLHTIQQNYTKARFFLHRALKIRLLRGNGAMIAYSYNDIATTYMYTEEWEKALKYQKKCFAIEKKMQNIWSLSHGLTNLANIHTNLGNLDLAEKKLDESLSYAHKIKLKPTYQRVYYHRYKLFREKKLFEKALESFELASAYSDSIDRNEVDRQIADLDKKYHTEKKEAEIKLLQIGKEVDNAIIQRQRIVGSAGALVIILITISSVVFFRGRQIQKHANQKLAEQNFEINQQREEIQSIANNLSQTNSYLESANKQVSIKNKHITDSIKYASRIQTAVLPSSELFEENFNDYFILFKPRDLVSGDFYWAQKANDNLLFAAADCTGHGVPGAFVSMLGISFLNEISQRKELKTPAQMLNELRLRVKSSLHQTESNRTESKDGMDIALCMLHSETGILQYSGAYNPLYIMRNHEIIEIKATRNPIGVFIKEKSFVNHEIQVQKGDVLYTFSDGYMDQFGGEGEMRLTAKRFKEILLSVSNEKVSKQKLILENEFNKWRGDNDQIDDVLILGVEI